MKKLFLALLTTLLFLLAASAALAASPSDYTCTECGNPCTKWLPMIDSTHVYHMPTCDNCGLLRVDVEIRCTPFAGSATCTRPAVCSECHQPDVFGSPDPNAHSMSGWMYSDGMQHYQHCTECGAEIYGDHAGGTATCVDLAICEVCYNGYGDHVDVHIAYTGWQSHNETQHVKYCDACGEEESYIYEDHYGGTATCASGPICEVCEEEYGEPLSTHNGPFGEWEKNTITQHWHMCETCGEYEYGDHTGGAATCAAAAVCDVCHEEYGYMSSTHTGNLSYEYRSINYHDKTCDVCNQTFVDRHTGGTATCESGPICDLCETAYGESLGGHDWGAWTDSGDGTHTRTCKLSDAHTETEDCDWGEWTLLDGACHERRCGECNAQELAEHTGGTATCASGPICEVCEEEYGEPLSTHNGPFGEWEKITIAQHWHMCETCGEYEYSDHTGGAATCAAAAVCDVCHEEYGFKSSTHTGNLSYEYRSIKHHDKTCDVCNQTFADRHTGGTATCESGPICDLCETAYGESLGGHDWGAWTDSGDGTHTRTCKLSDAHTETEDCDWGEWTLLDGACHERRCGECNAQELAEHTGGTATCASGPICEVCEEGYGSPDYSGMTGHPNPTIEEQPGTCYDEGYYRIICDEPGCSAPFTEFVTPANGQHIYNDWQPTGDDSHISACHYCKEELTVPCTVFTAELFAACPICGEYEGGVLLVAYTHDDDESLPYGTLVVRCGVNPMDGVLFAITVAGSYGGNVVELIAPVTVRVPVELTNFRIIDMNGQEVPFALENGVLTFETAAAGLFLLVPTE